ncbi:cell surface glycoprotein CD200 receptor 1-like [Eleutherodactylus coqui]|uniref:cell surface glycoprotein CD200 receptor 1-like n=1 Tax=Eleutherodactylus coqui TaxID=57060 RepID=UPI003462447E
MNMFLLLLVSCVLSDMAARADVVTVRRGWPVVLLCAADPGNTLLGVTWKLRLYNSCCLVSYKIDADNNKISYSNCSTRVRSDNLSLSISDTAISDEGTYTCEVVYDAGTVFRYIVLQVLAQPSTFLKLNSDGTPECGAIGGNPPANISWIPHSDDINTTIVEEPDQTWSVISTLSRERMNGNLVTCVVSHPTLINPWKEVIELNEKSLWIPYVVLGSVVSFLLILICLVIWKLPYLRTRFKTLVINDPEEDQPECEPYATYTQNDNVIYCVATKFVNPGETASLGLLPIGENDIGP